MTASGPGSQHLNVGGSVLAAVDVSAYTDSISRYSAWAAQRLAAPVQFLHMLDRHPEAAATADFSGNLDVDAQARLLEGLAALDESRSKLGQERGRLVLQQAKSIAEHVPGLSIDTRLRHGSLVDALTEMEAGVRLFVLGKRGEHADFAKGHLGSQLERVVRAVHRPLLVASRSYSEIQRVLIAFDGSPTTRKGVEIVAASPLLHGLAIHVVTVGSDNEANRGSLQWALDTLSAAGLTAQGNVQAGNPAATISQAVQDAHAELLVMGAYGHSRIRQLIVGSTTTELLRGCRIPVLLLR